VPIPRSVGRLNRVVANPLLRRVADLAPYFGTLEHRGRISGAEYRTPLNLFPVSGGFVIALTYGPDTDWRKNLFATGTARLVHRGAEIEVVAPRFIGEREALTAVPGLVRWSLERLNVHEYIRVDAAEVEV
jgi:deazaflavin-dependent oxidoreductase (nitroreductase family)